MLYFSYTCRVALTTNYILYVWFCSDDAGKSSQPSLPVSHQEWRVDMDADVSDIDLHSWN